MLLKKSFQCFLSTPQDSPPHARHAQDTPQMHTERNKAYFIPLNSLPVGCPEFSFQCRRRGASPDWILSTDAGAWRAWRGWGAGGSSFAAGVESELLPMLAPAVSSQQLGSGPVALWAEGSSSPQRSSPVEENCPL